MAGHCGMRDRSTAPCGSCSFDFLSWSSHLIFNIVCRPRFTNTCILENLQISQPYNRKGVTVVLNNRSFVLSEYALDHHTACSCEKTAFSFFILISMSMCALPDGEPPRQLNWFQVQIISWTLHLPMRYSLKIIGGKFQSNENSLHFVRKYLKLIEIIAIYLNYFHKDAL